MAITKVDPSQLNIQIETTEQDTGELWYDGRPIYRKVLAGTIVIAVGTGSIAHGITGLTSSFMFIGMRGGIKIAASATGAYSHAFPVYREASQVLSFLTFSTTNVQYYASYAWGSSYYEIELQYVK